MNTKFSFLISVASGLVLAGCGGPDGVIAVTGTNLGVEISYDQTRQTPQGILGYKRAEFVWSPIQVDGKTTTTTTKDTDGKVVKVDEVKTELRHPEIISPVAVEFGASGLFSLNTSIAQRIAIGSATETTGAFAMFAKGNGDTPALDKGAVDALVEKRKSAAVQSGVDLLADREAGALWNDLLKSPALNLSDREELKKEFNLSGGRVNVAVTNASRKNQRIRSVVDGLVETESADSREKDQAALAKKCKELDCIHLNEAKFAVLSDEKFLTTASYARIAAEVRKIAFSDDTKKDDDIAKLLKLSDGSSALRRALMYHFELPRAGAQSKDISEAASPRPGDTVIRP